MKVVERGDTWRQVACDKCNSKLVIEDTDIWVWDSITLSTCATTGNLVAHATCAVCKQTLSVKAPDYLKKAVLATQSHWGDGPL